MRANLQKYLNYDQLANRNINSGAFALTKG